MSNSILSRAAARLQRHPVLWLFLVTFVVTAWLNPLKVGLLLWGVSKLTAFAFLGHWLDRRFFADGQPEDLQGNGLAQGAAWKRKGGIVAAAIIAGALVP